MVQAQIERRINIPQCADFGATGECLDLVSEPWREDPSMMELSNSVPPA